MTTPRTVLVLARNYQSFRDAMNGAGAHIPYLAGTAHIPYLAGTYAFLSKAGSTEGPDRVFIYASSVKAVRGYRVLPQDVLRLDGWDQRPDAADLGEAVLECVVDVAGPIIVLEGPDGCGKTTCANAVAAILRDAGWEVEQVRMPGGTQLGELLRGPLKDASFGMSPLVKTLLFAAADQDASEAVVRASRDGKAVVVDRCALSNLAYRLAQEEAESVDLLRVLLGVEDDGSRVTGGPSWGMSLVPEGGMLFLLDAPDDVLAARIGASKNVAVDRFDGLWKKAAEAYRAFRPGLGKEAYFIDASRAPSTVSRDVVSRAIEVWLRNCGKKALGS